MQHLNSIEGILDYKTELQEYIQGIYKVTPEYRIVSATGPDHDKVFTVEVYINDKVIGRGVAKNKKEAENMLHKKALIDMRKIMIKRMIYPGSFNPVTKGHLDIIMRASKLTNELIVAVLNNANKADSWFSVEERIDLLKNSISELNIKNCNIRVISYGGLLVDLIEKEK